MASGTNVSSGTVVLVEPFDSLTAWTIGSGGAITAGGQVGNFYRTSGGSFRGYPIPAPSQSTNFDLTFWWRCNNIGTAQVTVITVNSASTVELAITVPTTKQWRVQTSGTVLGDGPTNAVAANVWYRVHFAAHMASTPNGWVLLDIDSVNVHNVTGITSYNTTPNTVSIQTANINGLTEDYDELILKTG
jgi:hypothetical protein